jgi:hypothetical protein
MNVRKLLPVLVLLGVAATVAACGESSLANVQRVDYRSFGQTATVIPTEAGKASPDDGAGVLGPSYRSSRAGATLRLRVVFNGLLSRDNEFVVAVFRQGERQALAVASAAGAAGKRVTVDKAIETTAAGAGPLNFIVKVGLARAGGEVYINGGPNGPDPTWPASYLEIGEKR